MGREIQKSQHDMMLPAQASDSACAPEWVHLLPAGRFVGRDGRGPWILEDAASVIAATSTNFGGADMPLDYNHQTELTSLNGQPAPAAGWFREMEARSDGIWARVEWTERGARAVTSREYRYISPAFFHDEEGRVLRFNSAALTNLPNLELKALSSAQQNNDSSAKTGARGHDVNFKTEVAQAVGLPDDASDTEIIAAIRAALAQANKALNSSMPDPSRFVPMEIYKSVGQELASLKSINAKSRTLELLSIAQKEGKVTPAMMSWAEKFAEHAPDYFKEWTASAPDLRPGGGKELFSAAAPSSSHASALTESQKAICTAMGHDEASYQTYLVSLKAGQ